MYPDLIKLFTITLFGIFICMQMLNQKAKSLKFIVHIFFLSSILSLISNLLFINHTEFLHLLPLIIFWIVMSLYTSRPQISFIVVSTSFGISYCIHAFSSLISSVIIYVFMQNKATISYIAISILSAVLHTIISLILLHKKRLRKGLPLANSTNYKNVVTLLCMFFIYFPAYSAPDTDSLWIKALSFFLPILLLAFLIYWWQAQITKAYRRQLELP